MGALPLELFDHIVSFLPLCDGSRYPSKDPLCCTTVSKALSISSRRRIFSTIVIVPSSSDDTTRATLRALLKLFQQHLDLLRSIYAVEIYVITTTGWLALSDILLHDILNMIQSRPQKLKSLKVSCRVDLAALETTFGRRTKETLINLVPVVQSLSLKRLIVSSSFLE